MFITLVGNKTLVAELSSRVKDDANSVGEADSWTSVNHTWVLHHLPNVSRADRVKRRTKHLVVHFLSGSLGLLVFAVHWMVL